MSTQNVTMLLNETRYNWLDCLMEFLNDCILTRVRKSYIKICIRSTIFIFAFIVYIIIELQINEQFTNFRMYGAYYMVQ